MNTNPALWEDPLWVALTRARTALEDNPSILREKRPEWREGLNVGEINDLCDGTVFEFEDEWDQDLLIRRFMTIRHPGPPDPIRIQIWPRYATGVGEALIARILAYLQAWMDVREQNLPARKAKAIIKPIPPPPANKPTGKGGGGPKARRGPPEVEVVMKP